MPTPEQARRALTLITGEAVSTATELVSAAPVATRDALLAAVPEIVRYYSDGSAALAADHYEDLREVAGVADRYSAEVVALIREDKIRTGVLWSTEALFRPEPDTVLATERLTEVVQYETARPFRQTITTNTRKDPAAVGWERIAGGDGCKFCRMLAGRGAVYKQASARFASHPHCDCTAAPVFDDGYGQEASVMQYVASKRTRSAREQQALRDFLAAMP